VVKNRLGFAYSCSARWQKDRKPREGGFRKGLKYHCSLEPRCVPARGRPEARVSAGPGPPPDRSHRIAKGSLTQKNLRFSRTSARRTAYVGRAKDGYADSRSGDRLPRDPGPADASRSLTPPFRYLGPGAYTPQAPAASVRPPTRGARPPPLRALALSRRPAGDDSTGPAGTPVPPHPLTSRRVGLPGPTPRGAPAA